MRPLPVADKSKFFDVHSFPLLRLALSQCYAYAEAFNKREQSRIRVLIFYQDLAISTTMLEFTPSLARRVPVSANLCVALFFRNQDIPVWLKPHAEGYKFYVKRNQRVDRVQCRRVHHDALLGLIVHCVSVFNGVQSHQRTCSFSRKIKCLPPPSRYRATTCARESS